MSKIALTPNASGSGTFTIASPNSDTDRTLTLPDEAGTVLTSASSIPVANLDSAVGITEVDQWYLQSFKTTDGIITDWARTLTNVPLIGAYIGTGMSHSSGVWTFPSTGVWKIEYTATIDGVGDDNAQTYMYTSDDGGSTWGTFGASRQMTYTVTNRGMSTTNSDVILNITNTSTDVVKFEAASLTAGSSIEGDSNVPRTWIVFTRMGDSV